jgi:tetratricopeptide (TPR) repeat protein
VHDALDAYHRGEYGTALYHLERLQQLRLPDGDVDFVMLVVAECYRMLGLKKQALDNYRYIMEHFPDGDKVAPSLFRCIEYAYKDDDVERADSLFTVFHDAHRTHPLATAVHYVMGKVYYRSDRFSEAAAILEAILRSSSRYAQAQFLAALCRCENSEWDKALYQLEYVRAQAREPELVNEATILIADIYSLQGNHETALQFYDAVPGAALRHEYVAVKRIKTLLALERLTEARDVAARFVRQNPDSDYYFEMASILEQTYEQLGERVNKLKISGQVYQELLNFRLSFEVMDELDRVAEAIRGWSSLTDA